jgi:hypothetical protein
MPYTGARRGDRRPEENTMKTILAALGLLVALSFGSAAQAADKKSTYLVTSPHTPEECLKALDSVSAMGSKTLGKYEWGCLSGDHTGYTMVEATSEEEALKVVPPNLREKAKAEKVTKFTVAQIKGLHTK